MERTRLYREGELVAEDFPLSEMSERLAADEHAVAWLDLCRPSEGKLRQVTEEFGLHRLAVEDVLHRQQRAKLDRYGGHLFLAAYDAKLDERSNLMLTEISAFITPRALITVRSDDGFDVNELVGRWDERRELAPSGVGFLLHTLLDMLVDDYFTVVQGLDASVEGLQDPLFAETGPRTVEVHRRSFRIRRDLVRLRQILLPMREVVTWVMRPSLQITDAQIFPYYQDLFDHVLRVVEWTEALRDLVASVLEANLTLQSNNQNIIMKKVTSWAAIIAVPTAITSFYGQNLPIPGTNESWSFILSSVLSVGLALGLYILFRRKEWL